MSLGVQGEVVGAGEGARAVETAERLGSGVLADVSRQLVRTREVPLTTGEVTSIRLLAYNARVSRLYSPHSTTPTSSRGSSRGNRACRT